MELRQELAPGTGRYQFPVIRLQASPAERLETWIVEQDGAEPYGVRYVCVKRRS
ncbi:MAG: hypothetical protein ABIP48_07770 [Planctomycetota bacterium]